MRSTRLELALRFELGPQARHGGVGISRIERLERDELFQPFAVAQVESGR